jgi:hypothetical protein
MPLPQGFQGGPAVAAPDGAAAPDGSIRLAVGL